MKFIKTKNTRKPPKSRISDKNCKRNIDTDCYNKNQYSNLKDIKIDDKDYLHGKDKRESAHCVSALADWLICNEYINYFITITFEPNAVKIDKYEVERFLNSFVFKLDRSLKSRLNKKISRLFVFPEDSNCTRNRGEYIPLHVHAILQIPTEYNQKFITSCTNGCAVIVTRLGAKNSIKLNAHLLTDAKSILTYRDCTVFEPSHENELYQWVSYSSKNIGEALSSFSYEDILIIQNNIQSKTEKSIQEQLNTYIQ